MKNILLIVLLWKIVLWFELAMVGWCYTTACAPKVAPLNYLMYRGHGGRRTYPLSHGINLMLVCPGKTDVGKASRNIDYGLAKANQKRRRLLASLYTKNFKLHLNLTLPQNIAATSGPRQVARWFAMSLKWQLRYGFQGRPGTPPSHQRT